MSGGSSQQVTLDAEQKYLAQFIGGYDQDGEEPDVKSTIYGIAAQIAALSPSLYSWGGAAPPAPEIRADEMEDAADTLMTYGVDIGVSIDHSDLRVEAIADDSDYASIDPSSDIHTATTGILAKALSSAATATTALLSSTKTAVEGSGSDGVINDMVSEAKTIVQTILDDAVTEALDIISSQSTQGAVDAFETRQRKSYLRSVNRFTGAMSMVNAVNSSAFIQGLVSRENNLNEAVRDYDAQITINLYQTSVALYAQLHKGMVNVYDSLFKYFVARDSEEYKQVTVAHLSALWQSKMLSEQGKFQHWDNAVNTMVQQLFEKHNVVSAGTNATIESRRIAHVMHVERQDTLRENHVKDGLLHLEKYQYGANVLGAMSGGTMSTNTGLSGKQSVLGGALSGASLGAQVGGAPGALVGGVIGGIAGFIGK